MSGAEQNSDAEGSSDYLHEQDHLRNRPSAGPMMSESVCSGSSRTTCPR